MERKGDQEISMIVIGIVLLAVALMLLGLFLEWRDTTSTVILEMLTG